MKRSTVLARTGKLKRSAPMRKASPKRRADRPMRQAARGERCTLRLGCCNHNPETTVLAHIRMFGWAGMAEKPKDYLAVFACSACHDALDRRRSEEWGFDDILRALGETLMRQEEIGTYGEMA